MLAMQNLLPFWFSFSEILGLLKGKGGWGVALGTTPAWLGCWAVVYELESRVYCSGDKVS